MSTKKKMLQAAAGNVGGSASFKTAAFLSHFDGENNGVNNVFEDSSSSNRTITANGNVTQGSFSPFFRETVNLYNVTYDASAEGNYINFGSSTHTFWDSDFTLEFWVKTTSTAYQSFFSSWEDASFSQGSYGFALDASGTVSIANRLSSFTNQGAFIASAQAINDNKWHHVAFTQVDDGGSTKYFRVFVDGVLSGYETESAWTQGVTQNGSYIGSQGPNTFGGTSRRFVGGLSNLRLSHSVVYSTSSTTIGEEIFSPPTDALAAPTAGFLTLNSATIVDNGPSTYTISSSSAASVSEAPVITKDPTKVYDPTVHGASAYFDGGTDYLTTPDSSDFDLGTDDFTIECWIHTDDIGSVKRAVIGSWLNSNRGWQARIGPSGSGYVMIFSWTSNGTTDYTLTSTIVCPYNQWNHLAWVRSGNTLTFYVNGVAGGAFAFNQNIHNSNAALQIGDWDSNAADFIGYMSDVHLVKDTALYTADFTPPTEPITPVTNTKLLLNMANGQVIDSTAQHNIRIFGNAKLSNTQAKFGDTSLYLDGAGDYVRFPQLNGPLDGADEDSPLTIEGWFYWDGAQYSGGFNTVIGINRLSDGNNTMLLYCGSSGGGDHLGLRYNGNSEQKLSDPIATNTWHHFAMVLNNGSYKFQVFLNGASVFTSATTINVAPSDCSFLIGAEADAASAGNLGDYFSGYIDDIRISKVARYTANFTPPTAPFPDKG